ncbi:hypothetical protein HK103_007418 [Boothiomyces macroporosus]|uniref:HOOK N-terminal domain-containing protein n=1 Tax=Boothiomyces macroporosus TaxID=261099 RepID=A0AAD5YAF8_9FUNG|nr:hypothetical protein HK103_007418 [Boothiomyces macroporosus]
MDAFLSWANTIQETTVESLANGQSINLILNKIDSNWFKIKPHSDNWVIQFNNLKLNYKLIGMYLQEMNQQIGNLEPIDFTKMVKNMDVKEIEKYCFLVISLCVQCGNNQFFIEKIQTLPQEHQTTLMVEIEKTINLLRNDKVKKDNVQDLEQELEALKQEKLVLENKLVQMGKSNSNEYNIQLETRIVQLEKENQELSLKNQQLSSKTVSLNQKLNQEYEKNDFPKIQLDEFKQIVDKLEKTEMMNEKLRKKIDDLNEQKNEISHLKSVVDDLNKKNNDLEEHFQKVAGLKPLIDTYKAQIEQLEEKNSQLHVEQLNLSFQAKEFKTRIKRYEQEHERDSEKIMELEEHIRDIELGVGESKESKDILKEQSLKLLSQTKELERVRVLENLLQDANSLKQKFQEDYQQVYKQNISLLNQIQQLKTFSDPSSADLVLKLTHAESQLKRMQSETDLKKEEKHKSRTSFSPDKRLFDENKKIIARCETLEQEKANLETNLAEINTKMMELSKQNTDLKSKLNVYDSTTGNMDDTTKNLVTATQKLGSVTEQNVQLHQALKQAKELIQSQDKKIKELKLYSHSNIHSNNEKPKSND